MAVKDFAFASAARGEALRGISELARAVRVTLGPKGRTVAIGRDFGTKITKDGVSVAREIEFAPLFQNAAVKFAREAALKTSRVAGDGTTTTVVLTDAILRGCVRAVAAGMNPMDVKRGVDMAVAAVVADLARIARPVTANAEIAHVATISANGDRDIGALIASAMERVGSDGVINIEDGTTRETELEVVHGMQFDRSYVSPRFITDPLRRVVEMQDAHILVSDKKLASIDALMPLLEKVHAAEKPLLIIAQDYEPEVVAGLVVNKLRAGLKVAAVKAPAYGELRPAVLEDIAVMTGGAVHSDSLGLLGLKLEQVSLEHLGRADKVTIDSKNTTIVGGRGSRLPIEVRTSLLRRQIEETDSDYDRDNLLGRLAKLSGGVAVVRVGGGSEAEVRERVDRFRNAVNATRAAAREGILPGGGVGLLRAGAAIRDTQTGSQDQNAGIAIVREAITWPARQIALNAGAEASMVVSKILATDDDAFGFDAQLGDFGDMLEKGILDSAKVVRLALQCAASVAGLLMTTEVILAERPGPPPPEMPGHDHHDHHDLDIDW